MAEQSKNPSPAPGESPEGGAKEAVQARRGKLRGLLEGASRLFGFHPESKAKVGASIEPSVGDFDKRIKPQTQPLLWSELICGPYKMGADLNLIDVDGKAEIIRAGTQFRIVRVGDKIVTLDIDGKRISISAMNFPEEGLPID